VDIEASQKELDDLYNLEMDSYYLTHPWLFNIGESDATKTSN
jgi:hypothetical protein